MRIRQVGNPLRMLCVLRSPAPKRAQTLLFLFFGERDAVGPGVFHKRSVTAFCLFPFQVFCAGIGAPFFPIAAVVFRGQPAGIDQQMFDLSPIFGGRVASFCYKGTFLSCGTGCPEGSLYLKVYGRKKFLRNTVGLRHFRAGPAHRHAPRCGIRCTEGSGSASGPKW